MKDRLLDPHDATVDDAIDTLHGEQDKEGNYLTSDDHPELIEWAARQVVRLATPFDAIQLGVLEAGLLRNPYRNFSHRGLKKIVRGIMHAIVSYQKAARAAARKQRGQ